MQNNVLLFLLFFSSLLGARSLPELMPSKSQSTPPKTVYIKGITVYGKKGILDITKTGVHLYDLNITPREARHLKYILQKRYLDKELKIATIENIKHSISSYYQIIRRPFIVISIPDQDITDDKLKLYVEETRVGNIQIKGLESKSKDYCEKCIRLNTEDMLSTDILGADVAWINRNPFRYAQAVCKAGEKNLTTDVDIIVSEKFPARAFVGTDNTGFKQTGYQRFFAGAYLGNFLGLNQLLTYQYTADYHFKRYQSHILSYEIPIQPWRQVIMFFGGLGYTKAPVDDNQAFNTHGKSKQLSGRYIIPFNQGGLCPQEFKAGVDFKRTNNNLVFGGVTVSQTKVNIFQFILQYLATRNYPIVKNEFALDVVISPGQLLPDMSRGKFNALRPGARATYFYIRSGLKQLYNLPKACTLAIEGAMQLTTTKLLASEQFALGGYQTVRGYQERAVNADNGLLLRFEPRFPPITLIPRKENSLTFFAFADIGYGVDQLKLAADFRRNQALVGVGPGFRYQYASNISLRFDWGYQLIKIQNNPGGHNRINFGAMLSF